MNGYALNYAFVVAFLSCLHGSERTTVKGELSGMFLSCLHGSEHHWLVMAACDFFLSCLHGSEL
ncbi:hypothetical protein F652_1810 [Enterobacteriaceae bacterium bta3-1]|nr:hypothetical protein F652_1810 [Enterobacteriaceae bacterium bta3-1]